MASRSSPGRPPSPRAASFRHAALAASLLAAVTVVGTASGDPPRPPAPKTAARAPATAPKRVTAVPASKVWHTPAPDRDAPKDASGRPMLALRALNTTDQIAVPAHGERGGFAPEDLDRAARVLREPSTGNEHPVDPRLLDLVYRIQAHFGAQEIRVVSGYRTPRGGATSNHGKGRAMDIVVPGATDEDVAKFVREQGFVGCGVYPVSGFVHVDVRERSFFWVDTSGPGKKNRTRGILGDLAARADARALERGERPVSAFPAAFAFKDVDALLAQDGTASAANSSPPPDEDDEGSAALPD